MTRHENIGTHEDSGEAGAMDGQQNCNQSTHLSILIIAYFPITEKNIFIFNET